MTQKCEPSWCQPRLRPEPFVCSMLHAIKPGENKLFYLGPGGCKADMIKIGTVTHTDPSARLSPLHCNGMEVVGIMGAKRAPFLAFANIEILPRVTVDYNFPVTMELTGTDEFGFMTIYWEVVR